MFAVIVATVLDELWQTYVQITGAVNALLLGAILVFSPRLHRTRSGRKLGVALLAYGYLLLSFTAVDNGWVPPLWWIFLADFAIVLTASALFLDYMVGSVGLGSAHRAVYLPPVLFLLAAALLGPELIAGPAINWVVLAQIGYTCLTTWTYAASGRRLATRPRHLILLLIGLWTLHAFQLSRLLLPDIGWLFDAVPLVGAALVLALTALVLTDSRTLRAVSQVAPSPSSAAFDAQAIDRFMRAEHPYLDPRLTLGQLARALDVSPRELSRLIGASADGSFYNLLNRHRVAEAKRLLADPAERRTSIEAIALMAGFRARSTFYDAFRRETGKTPAQFRDDRG